MSNDSVEDIPGEPEDFGSTPADRKVFSANDILHTLKEYVKCVANIPVASVDHVGKHYMLTSLQTGYTKGHLYKCVSVTEIIDEQEVTTYSWEDQNIGKVGLDNCSGIFCLRVSGSTSAAIRWTDPNDTESSNGVKLAEWHDSVLVRNPDRVPSSITDGTVVFISTVRNAYASASYVDTGLSADHEIYYYKIFPRSKEGNITNNDVNSCITSILTWTTIHTLITENSHLNSLCIYSSIECSAAKANSCDSWLPKGIPASSDLYVQSILGVLKESISEYK